ncbi:hypothetical protein EON66_02055 [archaeon]|nr:MAG: hypothetical protein EON66_02055 [archaeon]
MVRARVCTCTVLRDTAHASLRACSAGRTVTTRAPSKPPPSPSLAGADVHGVDVLSNPTIRQFMKEYSQWPTFPQLYVNGEFVGGCDIMTQLQQSGELASMLSHSKEAESKEDVN